jgi:hypothetical protein
MAGVRTTADQKQNPIVPIIASSTRWGCLSQYTVGSVGRPKDLDWRACYVLLKDGSASHRHIDSDVRAAAAAIQATTCSTSSPSSHQGPESADHDHGFCTNPDRYLGAVRP